MKRKFKQWWSSIPPISTKQAITSYFRLAQSSLGHIHFFVQCILKVWLFNNDNYWDIYSVISYHLFFMYLRSTLYISMFCLSTHRLMDEFVFSILEGAFVVVIVGKIQHYVIKFVNDLRQAGGFLQVLRFPPQIKLTAMI